jgi:hypothetical protein
MDGEEHSGRKVVVMNRTGGSIRDLIANPTGKTAPPEPLRQGGEADETEAEAQGPAKKADPLPRPGDAYRAHSRFMNRLSTEQRLILFVLKDFTVEGFSYADLRRLRWLHSKEPGQGPMLVLKFVEAVVTEVTITGQNLEDVRHWIAQGTMPWLWEQPDGFKTRDDTATVITSITIEVCEK